MSEPSKEAWAETDALADWSGVAAAIQRHMDRTEQERGFAIHWQKRAEQAEARATAWEQARDQELAQAFALQDRAEKAEARVRELEALYQQTHGVHCSWVEAVSKAEARLAALVRDLEAWADTAQDAAAVHILAILSKHGA